MLHIALPDFSDTALIPPTVAVLFLERTGVTEPKLQNPGNIEVLNLTGGNKLYSQPVFRKFPIFCRVLVVFLTFQAYSMQKDSKREVLCRNKHFQSCNSSV